MELLFENSKGKKRKIAEPTSYKEATNEINKFLKEHNFESYYTRVIVNKERNGLMFDVGSHTEFFYLEKVPSNIIKDIFPNLDKE